MVEAADAPQDHVDFAISWLLERTQTTDTAERAYRSLKQGNQPCCDHRQHNALRNHNGLGMARTTNGVELTVIQSVAADLNDVVKN